MLSQKPFAILASVLQLKGATSIRSAHLPSKTWFDHEPSENSSLITGFFETVESVSGVTKSFAAGVMITFTSAPSFTSNRTISGAL